MYPIASNFLGIEEFSADFKQMSSDWSLAISAMSIIRSADWPGQGGGISDAAIA